MFPSTGTSLIQPTFLRSLTSNERRSDSPSDLLWRTLSNPSLPYLESAATPSEQVIHVYQQLLLLVHSWISWLGDEEDFLSTLGPLFCLLHLEYLNHRRSAAISDSDGDSSPESTSFQVWTWSSSHKCTIAWTYSLSREALRRKCAVDMDRICSNSGVILNFAMLGIMVLLWRNILPSSPQNSWLSHGIYKLFVHLYCLDQLLLTVRSLIFHEWKAVLP